jgi:hypothetical protein
MSRKRDKPEQIIDLYARPPVSKPASDPLTGVGPPVGVTLPGSDTVDFAGGRLEVRDFLKDDRPRVNIICFPPRDLFLDFVQHALAVAGDQVAILSTKDCGDAWGGHHRSEEVHSRITRTWIIQHKGQDTGLRWWIWEPYQPSLGVEILKVQPRKRPRVMELQRQTTCRPTSGPEPGNNMPLNVETVARLPACPAIYAMNASLGRILGQGRFVGQSRMLKRSLKMHLKELSAGAHKNRKLQSSFKECPAEFSVRVLEYAPSGLWGKRVEIWLDRREAFWMKRYQNTLNPESPKAEPFDEDEHAQEKHNVKKEIWRLKSEIKEKEIFQSKASREQKIKELDKQISKLEVRRDQLSETRADYLKLYRSESHDWKDIDARLKDLRSRKNKYSLIIAGVQSPAAVAREIEDLKSLLLFYERYQRNLETEEQIFCHPNEVVKI